MNPVQHRNPTFPFLSALYWYYYLGVGLLGAEQPRQQPRSLQERYHATAVAISTHRQLRRCCEGIVVGDEGEGGERVEGGAVACQGALGAIHFFY